MRGKKGVVGNVFCVAFFEAERAVLLKGVFCVSCLCFMCAAEADGREEREYSFRRKGEGGETRVMEKCVILSSVPGVASKRYGGFRKRSFKWTAVKH